MKENCKNLENDKFPEIQKNDNETSKETSKLSFINSLETQRENFIEPDEREKYFVTFPYPYMNGKLHLGHLFSISKSDFMAYYKELQGYNVLFPLSFHCTGMPISASAKKLKDELDGKETDISTKSIIESFGFDDVKPFVDPVHWIKTFPKYCKASLEHFAANIDWRRSFITTDINKYYDSFIRWQFLKLRDLGCLSFGKRYSIYCPIDEQPCLDHDRRKGENIKPVQVLMCKLKIASGFLLVKYKPFGKPNKLVTSKNIEFIHCKINDVSYYLEEEYYNNIKYQVRDIIKIGKVLGNEIIKDCVFDKQSITVEFVDKNLFVLKVSEDKESTEKYEKEIKEINGLEDNKEMKMVETSNFVSIYMPEDEVISRSGGKCVVSLMDQWFLDYSDLEWKAKVKKCINRMICDDDTRSKLLEGVDWIYKWGFSRSFGLGSRIPWDDQYLIDSLSDSTIYMSLYTFKHLLFGDLEGNEEIIPVDKLDNCVWDYIFYGIALPESHQAFTSILSKCKKSFEYFYPVDLRVSGKDLIKNHLLFFVFNHVALFDEKYWPKRIYTNGHLMLNSEKMSKSTGNFLTVDSCLEKYGVSATRMCLAVCGDTNEDANFIEANANSYILKIFTFIKNIEELALKMNEKNIEVDLDGLLTNKDKGFIDTYLLEYLSMCIEETVCAYEKMKYSDVIKYGFFELTHLKETYGILNGKNTLLIFLIYKTMCQLLYPIMPTLCRHLITKYFSGDFSLPKSFTSSRVHIGAIEHLKTVSKKIVTSKLKKNNENVEILIGESWAPWKVECMKYIDSLDIERNDSLKENKSLISKILSTTKEILNKYKISPKKGNLFIMDYLYTPSNYETKLDEYEILTKFKFYIEENTGLNIKIVKDNEQGNHLIPDLNFIK